MPGLSDQLRAEQIGITRRLNERLARNQGALNLNDIDGSLTGWVTAAGSVVKTAHTEATELGADFYTQFRSEGGVRGPFEIVKGDFNPAKVQASLTAVGAERAKQQLARGVAPSEVRRSVFTGTAGAMTRHALAGSRDTVRFSASVDRRVVSWRRVTSANPCGFCAMLSMNSYTSTKAAGTVVGRYGKVRKRPGVTNPRPLGARFHDHCKCTVVPNIESQLPDGHAEEMERLEELWSDAVATVNSMGLKTGAEKSRAEVRVFSQYVRQADS